MDALKQAFKVIFGREAQDLSPAELVNLVAEGFAISFCGRELAERCLREIHDLTDTIPHEVFSYARREIYNQLHPLAPADQ